MRKIFFTVLVLSFFFNPAEAQKSAQKPKTVVVTEKKSAPNVAKSAENSDKIGLSVEKYIVDMIVHPDGTSVKTIEIKQKYNSDKAIEAFGKFERIFNGATETVEVLAASVIRKNGAASPLAANKIQILPTRQAAVAPAFSSLKNVTITPENLQIGDTTIYKIKTVTNRTIYEKSFSETEIFASLFDWKSVEINLSAPANFPIYTEAVDLQGGKIGEENGIARWRWTRENFTALPIEEAGIYFLTTSPKLSVTSFKNFDELGAAYWSEARKKSIVTPKIQQLADEITKGIKEPKQQAAAIYDWVNRNIRYLSVVLDRGGWIPHEAEEILTNGYGDCKDYTTLLQTLLKAKSIESHPVLIRSDYSDWFPEVAATDFFNHAILYIPSLDLYADATSPNTRIGMIPQSLVGKYAVLSGEKTGKIKIPDGKPEENQILSDTEIFLQPNGDLKSVSKNLYIGRSEMIFRQIFADSRIDGNTEVIVSMLLRYYGLNGKGKLSKITDSHKVGEPFSIDMEATLDKYINFSSAGKFLLPTGVNLVSLVELEALAKESERKSPLMVGSTQIREAYKISFPAQTTFADLPENINFQNKIGSYRLEFLKDGESIKAVRELKIFTEFVQPADYPLFKSLIAKLSEGQSVTINYSAAPNVISQSRTVPKKNNPKPLSRENLAAAIVEDYKEPKLTAKEAAQLEAAVKKNPSDTDSRKKLLRHYTSYQTKETPAVIAARTMHRLWFVENHPEISADNIFSYNYVSDAIKDKEYQTLKPEWLKQTEAKKSNPNVLLNAAEFFESVEPEIAEKILADGEKLFPEKYEFPLELSEIFRDRKKDSEKPEDKTKFLQKSFAAGERALLLLKKERSEQRNSKRADLINEMAQESFELGKIETAKKLATELALEFGENDYDAAHISNIILGRAALTEGDIAKAEKHLLIAVQAPLRFERIFLTPDMSLAKELFAKGKKDTVSEYLELCLRLKNFVTEKDLYEDEINAVNLWIKQIKEGKTPSFDFDNP